MAGHKRGMTLIRWNGPSHVQRQVEGWVWNSGDVLEIPDAVALELLTMPGDVFEAVNPADVGRLLAGGKNDYQQDEGGSGKEGSHAGLPQQDDKKELEDGDDIR
jgi:hypothetical protein